MKNEIEGKVVVITGAASGIGEACAIRLAGLGAKIVAADIDDERGAALVKRLGDGHRYVHLDVARRGAWKELADQIGKIDVLHLNAGVMSRPRGAPLLDDPLGWFTAEVYEKVRSVNLDSVVHGIMAAIDAKIPRIVVTASGAALSPLPMDPFYTTTKHAVLGLVLALAPSLTTRGIRIDVLCPGAVDTPITAPDIRASFKQESPGFIADALVQVLEAAQAKNHAWLAYTEAEGLKPYSPGGALDDIAAT